MTNNNLQYLIRDQNVCLVEASNVDFYRDWSNGSPSLVFIDAGHSYDAVKVDIDWAVRVSAKIICGDDFCYSGVRRAVEEAFQHRYYLTGGMWVHIDDGTLEGNKEQALNENT